MATLAARAEKSNTLVSDTTQRIVFEKDDKKQQHVSKRGMHQPRSCLLINPGKRKKIRVVCNEEMCDVVDGDDAVDTSFSPKRRKFTSWNWKSDEYATGELLTRSQTRTREENGNSKNRKGTELKKSKSLVLSNFSTRQKTSYTSCKETTDKIGVDETGDTKVLSKAIVRVSNGNVDDKGEYDFFKTSKIKTPELISNLPGKGYSESLDTRQRTICFHNIDGENCEVGFKTENTCQTQEYSSDQGCMSVVQNIYVNHSHCSAVQDDAFQNLEQKGSFLHRQSQECELDTNSLGYSFTANLCSGVVGPASTESRLDDDSGDLRLTHPRISGKERYPGKFEEAFEKKLLAKEENCERKNESSIKSEHLDGKAVEDNDGECEVSFRIEGVKLKNGSSSPTVAAGMPHGRPVQVYLSAHNLYSDEDVDWEEGDCASASFEDSKAIQKIEYEQDAKLALIPDSKREDKKATNLVLALADKARNTDYYPEYRIDDYTSESDPWPDNYKGEATADMVTALEHAQATASKLTDWAGRVFRRAIAFHAKENGVGPCAATPMSESQVKQSPYKAGDKANAQSTNPSPHKFAKLDVASSSLDSLSFESKGFNGSSQFKQSITEERISEEHELNAVTDEIRAETIELLRLFGIPYVEAPAEAEAQCVALEKMGFVDGIVTEDSDAFVFGGQVIYKNIFDDQKYVEEYRAKDAKTEMNLSQSGLVALAMLLGSDYTEGVKGVGIVNGMEILEAFSVSEDLKIGLLEFRKWLDGFDPTDALALPNSQRVQSKKQAFHQSHLSARTRWVAPKFFPDEKVISAYFNPVVDKSNERFSWGVPDLENLIVFLNRRVGWKPAECRRLLEPVLHRVELGSAQRRIESFTMRYEDDIKFAEIRSQRLQQVLKGVRSKQKEESGEKG